MSAHTPEAVKAEVRRYMIIGFALAIGTVVTVLASYVDFGKPGYNIIVALIIAGIKGFLVAGFFMHLISERVMIYTVLIATVFFFAGLMYITLWSLEPKSLIHDEVNVPAQAAGQNGAGIMKPETKAEH
jgi:cytochrome c oxidase subunit 4